MALRLIKVGELVGDEIIVTAKPSIAGDFAAILTNLEHKFATEVGPAWTLPLEFGEGAARRKITIDLPSFLSMNEYSQAKSEPLIVQSKYEDRKNDLIIFRDRFFLTERIIRTKFEREEVILRAKKIVYDEQGEVSSLRSFVANIEAAVEYQRSGPKREAIPDDVKLLVWSRDGGACVRCNSKERLQFDHIVPFAKGGSNDSVNIQLLCQPCNLRKSDKIAF